MGLLDGSGFFNSSSSPKTSTQTSAAQTTQGPAASLNLSLARRSRVEGDVVVNNNNIDPGLVALSERVIDESLSTVGSTVGDAISTAGDIATEGIISGERVALEGLDIAGDVFDNSLDLTRETIDLSARSLDFAASLNEDIIENSFGFAEAVSADRLDSQGQLLQFSGDTIADVVDSQSGLFEDVVSFVGDSFTDLIGFTERANDENQAFLSENNNRLVSTINEIQTRESLNNDARISDLTTEVVRGAGIILALAIGAFVFVRAR